MSVRCISELLVATIWICAFTIPAVAEIDAIPNELDAKKGSGRICPKSCKCTETFFHDSITARCTELIKPEYSEANITDFVFEKTGDVILGRNDLRVQSLDHVQAIEIKHPDELSDNFTYFVSINPTWMGTLKIHPDIFKNKTELKILVIQQFENLIDHSDTTGGYLFDAPSIEALTFSVLTYEPWSASTFIKMSNLTSLHLVSPNFIMDSRFFTPIPKLLSLKIERASNWTDIGPNDFILIQALEKLTIGDGITRIDADAFSYLSKLKHLDISGNKIDSFTDKHLRNNQKLEVLRMSYNHDLKLLPVFKLENANSRYSIREFQCIRCGLESITDGTFSAMPSLETINLDRNRLESLPREFFKPLTSLKSLGLSDNLISYIPTSMFEGANELSDLDLSRNNLKSLPREFFKPLTSLKSLDLSDNLISHIPTSMFEGANELSDLDLSRNHLKSLPREFFKPLTSLKSLDLSDNLISHIPTSMFEGANELSDLDLSRNPITTLDIVPYLAAPKLMKLILNRCRIETWKATSTPHHSLSSLSIELNYLKNITVEHLRQLSNISRLNLIYNPVSCVQYKDIIIWSQAHNVTTEFSTVLNTNCIPRDGETCWTKFHEIVCSNNYTSVLDEIEPGHNRFSNVVLKTGENKGNASAINQFMISLILIVTTITVAINKEYHILYV